MRRRSNSLIQKLSLKTEEKKSRIPAFHIIPNYGVWCGNQLNRIMTSHPLSTTPSGSASRPYHVFLVNSWYKFWIFCSETMGFHDNGVHGEEREVRQGVAGEGEECGSFAGQGGVFRHRNDVLRLLRTSGEGSQAVTGDSCRRRWRSH